jgi:hypothetical protein
MAHLTPEEFGARFDSLFQRSAFRLELLDKYIAENEVEPLRRFLAGQPQDPAWREPWARFVRASVRGGKQMARVHVVDEPLSDYLRFELACGYPASMAAGEDIRILQLSRYPFIVYPRRDFWLFDDSVAVMMDYDDDGNFLGAHATSAPVEIARYRLARKFIMQDAVPLTDYLASLGIKEAV